MKCENNQGFKVKPYETCDICFGSGTVENKKKTNKLQND